LVNIHEELKSFNDEEQCGLILELNGKTNSYNELFKYHHTFNKDNIIDVNEIKFINKNVKSKILKNQTYNIQ